MTKLFRVMPKRIKCSDGIGLTIEMVVVGEKNTLKIVWKK